MVEARWPNLVTMFFRQADRYGERPLLWRKRDGRWTALTWREVAARICALARGLKSLGLARGDRVLLVSENRPNWLIADFAIMAAGGITVPAYTTNTVADHQHVLEDSGAVVAIVSNRRLAERLLPAIVATGHVRALISIDDLSVQQTSSPEIFSWKQAISRGESDHTNLRSIANGLQRSDPACIIYTSGTGGAPKGVVLPHGSMLANIEGATGVLEAIGFEDEVFLSFLPLSHAYEHTVGQMLPLAIGAQIYYAEGIDRIPANMLEARPTIIAGVPRFYELLYERILHTARRQGGWRERMLTWTLQLGRARQAGTLSLWQRPADFALEHVVRRKVRERFGGRLKALVAGGAPLAPDVGQSLRALGLPVFQGYGQTEAGPLISVNHPNRPKLDTVGPSIKGAEVRIAEDGEILVRGELLMLGYWRNPEATAAALQDGWLHTGDIGEIDADGDLRITDRKKDMIVNSGGDNLSPARIENLLVMRPEIAQAMVYGDRRPHLVALLVPNADWTKAWAEQAGKSSSIGDLARDAALKAALGKVVDEVNRGLSTIERVRRIAVAHEPFSIDNGQLTPTLKIKRHVLRRVYGTELEALYE